MNRTEAITMIFVGVFISIVAKYFLDLNSDRKENVEPVKITFDFIETPGGRLTRFYDCGTQEVCYSTGGVISCVNPNSVPKVISDRCAQ